MTTITGIQITRPAAESIIELDANTCWYLVTVAWEYDVETYVMNDPRADCIAIDFTDRIVRANRDEGFVIVGVKLIR